MSLHWLFLFFNRFACELNDSMILYKKGNFMLPEDTVPQRLYLMRVATIPERNLPFVCYLVQMSDGTNVLIDSGLPEDVQLPPGLPMPNMEKSVIEQLAQLGLQTSD